MKTKGRKNKRTQRLKHLCQEHNVDFDSLGALLDSVKSKKMIKQNYHQQRINEEIEKAVK